MPSYVHYDYNHKLLYVCDRDKILAYKVKFHGTDLVPKSVSTVISDIECGGLDADKFGNLFYVDKKN